MITKYVFGITFISLNSTETAALIKDLNLIFPVAITVAYNIFNAL